MYTFEISFAFDFMTFGHIRARNCFDNRRKSRLNSNLGVILVKYLVK